MLSHQQIKTLERQFAAIDLFAAVMKQKIRENVDKGDWIDESYNNLFNKLEGELNELHSSVALNHSPMNVVRECADVANYVMMIADNYSRKET
jgi:NTP pyrophosphatase (non-canonical NTP hydrolase)